MLLRWVSRQPTWGKALLWLAFFPVLVAASAVLADPSDSGRAVGVGAGALVLLAGFMAFAGGPSDAQGDREEQVQRVADIEVPTFTATEVVTVQAEPEPAETVTVEAEPVPAETVTVDAEPEPAETITVEAEPLPAETVTVVETETEIVEVEVEPLGLLEDPADSSVYYENCDAARADGAAPVRRGDPGYAGHLDRDDDGIGCE